MKPWNRGRPRVQVFAGLLAILLTVALAEGLVAQVIGIVEPVEWRDGRAHAFQAGRSLRIAGLASHPGGVTNVLVNGQQARLQADPDFPDSYNFEHVLAPENVTGEIVIVIVPRTGERFEQRYRVNMPAAPPPRTETPPRPAEPQIQQAGNPWGGFKVRGILYGVAAAGGLALTQLTKSETSEVCEQVQNGFDCFNRTETKPAYKGPGLALAGVAGVALVIDALLTSRKAKSPVDGGPDDGSEGGAFRIELPNLQPSPEGARLELLRIRFRSP
jgi:hypothetical protein